MKGKGLVLALILLGAAVILWVLWNAWGIPARLDGWKMVYSLVSRESLLLHVELDTDTLELSAEVFRDRLDGEDLLGLSIEGNTFYCWKDCLYLDNGRGYDLSGILPEELEDWETYLPLLLLTEYTVTESGDATSARFRITDDQLDTLTKLRPEWDLSALKDMSLTVTAIRGAVQELVLPGRFGSLRAVVESTEPLVVDPALFMEMKAGNEIPVERVLPLIRGCLALSECDPVGAEAELALSCGLLPIRDKAELYHTEGRLILVRGEKAFPLKLSFPDIGSALFPALGYLMLRDGELISTEDGTEYHLTIQASRVEALFDQILPEAAGLGLTFEEAEASLSLEGDALCRIHLSCRGDMPFLMAQIPIGFSMDLTMMDHPLILPDLAREALSRG